MSAIPHVCNSFDNLSCGVLQESDGVVTCWNSICNGERVQRVPALWLQTTPTPQGKKDAQDDVMSLFAVLDARFWGLGKVHRIWIPKGGPPQYIQFKFRECSFQVSESYAGFKGLEMGFDSNLKNGLVMWTSHVMQFSFLSQTAFHLNYQEHMQSWRHTSPGCLIA